MSQTHTHAAHTAPKERSLFYKIVRASLVPLGWLVLGIVCYLYKTDLSKKAGLFFILLGLVSLTYNLLRVNRKHAEKKKSLHL